MTGDDRPHSRAGRAEGPRERTPLGAPSGEPLEAEACAALPPVSERKFSAIVCLHRRLNWMSALEFSIDAVRVGLRS